MKNDKFIKLNDWSLQHNYLFKWFVLLHVQKKTPQVNLNRYKNYIVGYKLRLLTS